jgi:hypothetical protein
MEALDPEAANEQFGAQTLGGIGISIPAGH